MGPHVGPNDLLTIHQGPFDQGNQPTTDLSHFLVRISEDQGLANPAVYEIPSPATTPPPAGLDVTVMLGTLAPPLPNAQLYARATAVDLAGNEGPPSETLPFVYDRTAPSAPTLSLS
jgi:hypothetical protein